MSAIMGSGSVERPPAAEARRYFAYFYVMKADPDAVRLVAPVHAEYWNQLGLPGYTGGPFADHSGGLIIFAERDAVDAQRRVDADPFVINGLIGDGWLKEWIPAPG